MTECRNLLVVTEEFTSGGVETHIRGEIQQLSELGMVCHLACGERFSDTMLPPEVATVTTGVTFHPEASVQELLEAIERLSELVVREKISAIHLHGFTSLVVGSFVAELQGVRCIISIHGPSLSNSAYGPLFDFLLDSVVLPGASGVVVVSEELRNLYAPYVDPRRLVVLRNAVTVPSIRVNRPSAGERRWLYASRLDGAKVGGLIELLKFVQEESDLRIDIAGDGPESEFVQRWVCERGLQDRIRLLGLVEGLPSRMPEYDMVFGMGRVVLEGLAAGVPACLVGYDGIKGVVTERLFERAAWANFSGRHLTNIDETELRKQIERASSGDGEALHQRLVRDFSESSIWKEFAAFVAAVEVRPPGFLSSITVALGQCAGGADAAALPYLSSPIVCAVAGRCAAAPQFRSAGLTAAFSYHFNLSGSAAAAQTQADLNERLVRKEIALRDSSAQLQEAKAGTEAAAKEIVRLTAEADRLRDECSHARSEAVKISDWACRIDRAPLRYGLKKHSLAVLRKVYHWLPVERQAKGRLHRIFRRGGIAVGPGKNRQGPVDRQGVRRLTKTKSCSLQPGRRDVFIFAVIDWHFRFQRPQQLANGLAHAGKRVFYISNEFIDCAESGYDIERLGADIFQVRLRVAGAPAIYASLPSPDTQARLLSGLGQLMLDYCVSGVYGIVHHPFWKQTAWSMPNCVRVYDCMDHHEGFGGVDADLVRAEESLLRHADQVIVTSSWLDEFARKHARDVVLIRNAGDYDFFSREPEATYQDALGRKIVGYYGAIAEWFDVELMAYLADKNPDVLFLLVGRDTVDAGQKLSRFTNIRFTGEVPYRELPHYLYGFDVCLLPFQVLPLTLATNPVKVYEYLAAGRPVVATDLPEMLQFEGCVGVAKEYEAFQRELMSALNDGERPDLVERRRAFAQGQTWIHRARDLIRGLDAVTLPCVSIVVLTYNNIGLSRACLRSLLERTDYPNFEVIVVDNASTDETPEFLASLAASDARVRVRLNQENLGFAAGNNVGLAEATGDYLVLLNNDTVVTDGWLMTLVRHLQDDPDVGLVGPVTNNIGNEARIDLDYDGESDMYDLARTYTLAHIGTQRPLRNIAFFCVAMPRSTYELCGPLCTDYGLGFFEDDDYCRRVEQAGLKILCVEDVFVHHHLSASFSKLGSMEKTELFDRNKAIYEAKWGRWVPHEYR